MGEVYPRLLRRVALKLTPGTAQLNSLADASEVQTRISSPQHSGKRQSRDGASDRAGPEVTIQFACFVV